MTRAVRVKPGVTFTTIAPAGFRLLGAIEQAARICGVDLVITSACDGPHSGPRDPHKRGEAYDVRSKNLSLEEKWMVLRSVMLDVSDDMADDPQETSMGIATAQFYGFLEAQGSPNEHLHFQRRRGRTYP